MAERFSGSVAGRHMACHASANLPLAIPGWQPPVEDRTADNAANRGTAKHEYLEPILALPRKDIDSFAKLLRYVADLRATRRFKLEVELSVRSTWLANPQPTKVDYVLYTQDEIHVIDWKWGDILVEAKDNAQLMWYALCVAGLAPRAKGVHCHIVQPSIDNFDMVFVDTNELKQFMEDTIKTEAAIAAGDVTFGPTDKHCTFCPANPRSRGAKAGPYCPPLMQLWYPNVLDEDEILALD
jgi:hypothetical protein